MPKPKKPRSVAGLVPTWEREHVYARMQKCRVMLYCHDLLTEAENERVKRRIGKAFGEEA